MDVAREGLRLVMGGAASTALAASAADPVAFQDGCLLAFEASQVARGFSQTSMDNGSGVLERFLTACGCPAWDGSTWRHATASAHRRQDTNRP